MDKEITWSARNKSKTVENYNFGLRVVHGLARGAQLKEILDLRSRCLRVAQHHGAWRAIVVVCWLLEGVACVGRNTPCARRRLLCSSLRVAQFISRVAQKLGG
ncbi:hypothetical protein A2U01_0042957 [Trifolium medium]|uniref:Uncharacterized protein n=1 Tax=Trifolium medium TaxID=97028 RepID=A0A392QD66_9FABA|nr:hypothetical protein [Trifolium medium]